MSKRPQRSGKEKARDDGPSTKSSKGKGKKASNRVPPFDEHRFVCHEAALAFEKGRKRALVAERGLDYQSFGLNMFAERGWHQATVQPGKAAELIVREFYANAQFRERGYMVMVRGVMVCYSALTINNFFGIPLSEDGYFPLFNGVNRALLDEIVQVLGIEGAEWRNIDGAAVLKERMLNRNSKAIHQFICGRMTPTGHKSEATLDRAVLNFAIQTGVPVNFGLAVHNAIAYVLKGLGTGGLVFPQLITELCRQAGVVWEAELETFRPQTYIKNSEKFGRVRGALGPIPGQGHDQDEMEQEQGNEQVPFVNIPGPGNYDARFDALEASQRELMEQFGGLRGDYSDLRKEIGEIRGEQRVMLQHTDVVLQRLDSMNYMMQQFAGHFSIDTSGRPAWPQYQPFHSPPPPDDMDC